jgi:integrase
MSRPKHVHPKNGAYYYVRKNKWAYLCRIEEGDAALYKALAAKVNPTPDSLGIIFQHYLSSAEIGTVTRKEYTRVLTGILTHRFGHMRPDDVEPADIAEYLEDRKREGAAVAGNRERAALSSVFEFAMRNRWARSNPCRGVRRNKERPSKVYVETDALSATYDRASAALQLLLNGAYLSGMRLTDLMALRRDQLTESGARWKESKTGHENEMRFKPGMVEVIRRAIAYGDGIATKLTKRLPKARPLPEFVFVNTRGKQWTQWGVSSAMRYADAPFAFRQLRAKAQTDSPENVLGHEGQMRSRYTRRRKLTSVA